MNGFLRNLFRKRFKWVAFRQNAQDIAISSVFTKNPKKLALLGKYELFNF